MFKTFPQILFDDMTSFDFDYQGNVPITFRLNNSVNSHR